MTDRGEQISELLKSSGKSSADMTHSLKELGDGSMQDSVASLTAALETFIFLAAGLWAAKHLRYE